MGRDEKQSYLEAIRRRYRKSSRKQKAKILDEFCAVCAYNRKYAIRLLHRRRNIRRQRKPDYEEEYGLLDDIARNQLYQISAASIYSGT